MNRFFKLFEGAWRDLRYAGRMLRKHLLFSLAIVVTVALGIGANASIFGVINAVLLEPLPYKNPDRLVRLWESNLRQSQPESPVSVPNYQDWQRQQSAFEEVAALEMATYNITDWGEPQRVASARITTNLVPMLGVAPALGRSFLPEEEEAGHNRVALLSDGLWQRQFGADRSIINKTIRLNGESYTVVGVMPAGFQFPGNREMWVPLVIDPQKEPWRADRTNRNLSVFGRLKPGISFNQAISDMDTVAQRLEQQHAESNTGWRVRMKTFYDWIVPKEVRTAMLGLFVAVGLLLLIACVNVANLLLADATKRAGKGNACCVGRISEPLDTTIADRESVAGRVGRATRSRVGFLCNQSDLCCQHAKYRPSERVSCRRSCTRLYLHHYHAYRIDFWTSSSVVHCACQFNGQAERRRQK